MYRGTTPNIVIKVNSDLDLSTMTEIWVTVKNKGGEVNYAMSDGGVSLDTEEKTLTVLMSQKDTLAFQTCGSLMGKVELQVRMLDENDLAYASNIKEIELLRILKDGVIA